MQLFIVIIILAIAVFLTLRHFYKALTSKEKGCYGCPLKEVCDKKKHERKACNHPCSTTKPPRSA